MMGIDWGYALGQGILGGANAVNQIANDEEKKRAQMEAEKRAADQRLADHERILAMNEVAAARAEQRKIETNRVRRGEVDTAVNERVSSEKLKQLGKKYGGTFTPDMVDQSELDEFKVSESDKARYGAEEASKRGYEDIAKDERGLLATETADERYKAETNRKTDADIARAEARNREADIKEKIVDLKSQLAAAKGAGNKDLPASTKALIDFYAGRAKSLEAEAAKLLTGTHGELPKDKEARETARLAINQQVNELTNNVLKLLGEKVPEDANLANPRNAAPPKIDPSKRPPINSFAR
jgi:hypothetical protein